MAVSSSVLYVAPIVAFWLLAVFSGSCPVTEAQPCPEFCQCNGTARVVVICEGQSFTTVPALQFNFMNNATIVTLGDNAISALPRYSFFHLTSLRWLYLYNNDISDIHVDAFRGLRHLELLSLATNNISTLPVVLFEELGKLQKLFLHENKLTGEKISKQLFQPIADSLQSITLDSNNITGIQQGTFSSLNQLQSLGLGRNPITRVDDGAFSGMPSLLSLNLALCQIETIGERAFANLTALTNLDLSYNRLTTISRLHFVDLVSLRDLHLQFNRITTIDDGAFFRLSHLRQLFIQSNLLTEIRPGMFSGLSSLQILWLDRNRIETIQEDTFQDLGKLYQLYLQNNLLKSLSYCQFKGATLMQILVLQYNQISCVADSAFCCLPYLTRLYLGANDLQIVTPRMLSCMTQVTRLSLSGNRIEFVGDGSFNALTSLNDLSWDYSNQVPAPSAGTLSNDFVCDCNAIYFKGFMERSPNTVNGVRCSSPASLRTKELRTIHQDSLNCSGEVTVSIVIDDYKSPSAFRLPPSPSNPAAVETIVVPRGDDLHLVSRASPRGVTFWTKGGKALVAHDCGTVTPQGNLQLVGMGTAQEGLYTLVVQSASGATAHSVFVTVGETSRIGVAPRDVEMDYPGANVMLLCVVSGQPKPVTRWIKDGVALNLTMGTPSSSFGTKSPRFVQTATGLHILDTVYADQGIYTCVASNGVGRPDRREAEVFFRRATPCTPSCRNNGTCIVTRIHTCSCTRDYIGEVCERPKPECDGLYGMSCGGDDGSGSGSGSGEVQLTDPTSTEDPGGDDAAGGNPSIETDGRPAGSSKARRDVSRRSDSWALLAP